MGKRFTVYSRPPGGDWHKVAVPPQGRYVRRPAVTDERGVVSVPPPVTDPQLVALAGAGLAAVALGLMLRRGTDRRG